MEFKVWVYFGVKKFWGVGIVAQWVKLSLGTPTSSTWMPGIMSHLCLYFQLPANVPQRQKMMAKPLRSMLPTWEPEWSSRLPALAWPNPGCCDHLGNTAPVGRWMCVRVCVSIYNLRGREGNRILLWWFTPQMPAMVWAKQKLRTKFRSLTEWQGPITPISQNLH